MFIPRDLEPILIQSATKFPILSVCGPRQSGKTTLIRKAFPSMPYVNLEQTKERQFAIEDRSGFLERFPSGAIFDEIQRVPDLLSDLQVIVDENKKMGQFVISGSQQFNLLESITQSLAGRTTILRLLPLTISELQNANIPDINLNRCLWNGFYPGKFERELAAEDFYGAYEESYVERDLKQLVNVKDLSTFRRFLKLCAGRVGSILNKDSLSRDVGISPKTVEHWLTLLETSFILFRLEPWHTNFGKRLIKSPKLYFYDVGLACYLLGIYSDSHIDSHPLKGELFENMQVAEMIKSIANQGLKRTPYFYRDSNGNEIDLILENGNDLLPIEIKSSKTFSSHFMDFLKKFEVPQRTFSLGRWLVMGFSENYQRGKIEVISWDGIGKKLKTELWNKR